MIYKYHTKVGPSSVGASFRHISCNCNFSLTLECFAGALRSQDVEGTGQAMFFLTMMSWSNNVFLVNASSKLLDIIIGHLMKRVLGNVLCDLDPKVMVKDLIIYFLVNVSNFAAAQLS